MSFESRQTVSFEEFLFDANSGDLTRNGVRIKVNKQVTDLLALLIANAGQLVTREQIRESLWPGQEYLNHEKIITNLASRLRLTLEDDPSQPRFIESIPKRGYRWLHKPDRVAHFVQPESPLLPAQTPAGPFPHVWVTPPRRSFLWPWALVAVLLLFLGLFLALFLRTRRNAVLPVPTREVSVGIVPFETDNSPETKDLAESFRLDLTDSLAQLPQIHVRAAHSLEGLSQHSSTFTENASHLGLDVLVFGKLKLIGNKCTLEFELVHGKDLSHLSSFSLTGPVDDLTHLRDQVQIEMFSQLNPSSIGTVNLEATLAPGSTTNREAYAAYLRGSFDLAQQTPDSLRAAVRDYQEAVAADPQFGHAHAHLARAYVYLSENSLASRQEAMDKAVKEADEALDIDPNDANAHDVRGIVYVLRDWNLQAGEHELQQAILLSPNEALHHQWLALVYCNEGRFTDSLREIDIAHHEDPYWISAYTTDAHISSMARDKAHAQIAINRLTQLVPQSTHALDAIANSEWYLGRYQEAIANWRAMAVLEGDTRRIALEDRGSAALRTGGPKAYAHVRLEAIDAGNYGTSHANDFLPGEWAAMAGETEQALAALRRGIASHDLWMLELSICPAFDSLRSNAEFQSMVTQVRTMNPQYRSS